MNKTLKKVNENNMKNTVLEKENAPRGGHLRDHVELSLNIMVSQPFKETTLKRFLKILRRFFQNLKERFFHA